MLPDSISKILYSQHLGRLKTSHTVQPANFESPQAGVQHARKLQRITQTQTSPSASTACEPLSSEVIMPAAEFDPEFPDPLLNSRPSDEGSVEDELSGHTFSQAEKFDLLSAYLDDEVSEQEKCLVENWLAYDVQLQKYYQNQLKIRQAIRSLGAGAFSVAADSAASEPKLETDSELDEYPIKELSSQEASLNVFSPLNLLGNRSLRFNSSQLTISDALAAQSAVQVLHWKKGLLVIVAALGATVVTLLNNTQTERRRPANLNRFRELSSQSFQGQTLKGQLP